MAASVGAGRGWKSPWVDGVIGIAILAVWIGFIGCVTDGDRGVSFDTFRDMAYAHNILGGRICSDPTIRDMPFWYAPGNQMLAAAQTVLTGCTVTDVFGYSLFWFNGLIPVALFVLVRVAWDRATALTALPMVWVGPYWWLTHSTATMSSTQGLC